MKKNNGFVSILFMLFILPLFALVIAQALIAYTSASKDLYRHQCVEWGLTAQARLSDQTQDIFNLNPLSTKLRLQLKILQASLMAAISSGNAGVAAQIQNQIQQLKWQQQQLDLLQKQKIHAAYFESRILGQRYLYETQMAMRKFDDSWLALLIIQNHFQISQYPQLGLQPDSIGGLAPNYELSPQYKQQRIMVFEWQNRHQLWKIKESLPFKKQSLRITCEIFASFENQKWRYETRLANP